MRDLLAASVYLLCFGTSTICAVLLGRSYRCTRARLLMWSSLCFVFLALNNLFVVVDLLIIPNVRLQIPRLALSFFAVFVLLFGLIWDLEERL